MKESTGGTFLLYWICIFLIITFAFLAATLSYMKAYKINTRIANAIEKYEGYNSLSNEEINTKLSIWAYRKSNTPTDGCPTIKGKRPISGINYTYDYCVYEFKINDHYYNYGVRTYIHFDLPIIHRHIRFPIYSETERIYDFEDYDKSGWR